MPNELAITATAPPSAITPNAERLPAVPVATPPPPTTAPGYPNPALHIDPSSNIVVMAFHDAKGELIDQTPSPKQLDAYRQSMPPR